MVGKIGVRRTKQVFDVFVIFTLLILVFDDEANGRTRGLAFEDARKDFDPIRLLALRRVLGSTGPAAIQIRLQICLAQRHTRGATIDDRTQRRPVALAKGGNREQRTERVS